MAATRTPRLFSAVTKRSRFPWLLGTPASKANPWLPLSTISSAYNTRRWPFTTPGAAACRSSSWAGPGRWIPRSEDRARTGSIPLWFRANRCATMSSGTTSPPALRASPSLLFAPIGSRHRRPRDSFYVSAEAVMEKTLLPDETAMPDLTRYPAPSPFHVRADGFDNTVRWLLSAKWPEIIEDQA